MKSEKQIKAKIEWFKEDLMYKAPEQVGIINYDKMWIDILSWVLENNNGFNSGDKVIYKGSSEAQRNFGKYSGNFDELEVNKVYTIDYVDIHSSHTKLYLIEHQGSFNSVCFEKFIDDTL